MQGSNLGLLNCRQTLCGLSHQRSLGSIRRPILSASNAIQSFDLHFVVLILQREVISSLSTMSNIADNIEKTLYLCLDLEQLETVTFL